MLIVIGSGLSQRDTMQWDPKMLPSTALIHIDADLILIGRTWPSDVPVVANAAAALERLAALDSCEGLEQGRPDRRSFLKQIRDLGPPVYNEEDTRSGARPMHHARVMSELRKSYPADGVLPVERLRGSLCPT